uniref:Uncharacterized protein n=1 Tax=Tanacetum cinerariifolium TaxID=118510 RepID=A0A6L2NHQ1_TANCI|nr:hypothetical protein [Tanacetum cinerariifolium]
MNADVSLQAMGVHHTLILGARGDLLGGWALLTLTWIHVLNTMVGIIGARPKMKEVLAFTSTVKRGAMDSPLANGEQMINHKLCPQSLRRGRRVNKKMRVLLLHLVFTFPSKLGPSSRIPTDLHDWNSALLYPLNFLIHNFDGFLNETELVIDLDLLQRNG